MLSDFSVGVDKNQLINMYKYATKDKFNFLLIACDENDPLKRYRHNFVDYLNPDDYK
jgi:hypothetical protein